MSWYHEGLKDRRAGKDMRLPTERNLSAFEKVVGGIIPGVNILVAMDLMEGGNTEEDDNQYIDGYKDAAICGRR